MHFTLQVHSRLHTPDWNSGLQAASLDPILHTPSWDLKVQTLNSQVQTLSHQAQTCICNGLVSLDSITPSGYSKGRLQVAHLPPDPNSRLKTVNFRLLSLDFKSRVYSKSELLTTRFTLESRLQVRTATQDSPVWTLKCGLPRLDSKSGPRLQVKTADSMCGLKCRLETPKWDSKFVSILQVRTHKSD